jgi:hypothetical protein
MSMDTIESADRYAGKWPNPDTMCKGDCEGMGVVPIYWGPFMEPAYAAAWEAAEKENPTGGAHFLKCKDCGGTGKRDI